MFLAAAASNVWKTILQFHQLSDRNNVMEVKVVRSSREALLSSDQLVVR
jgi:hypothetical protein